MMVRTLVVTILGISYHLAYHHDIILVMLVIIFQYHT